MNDLDLTDRIAAAAPVADGDVSRVFSEVAVEQLLTEIVGSSCDTDSAAAPFVRPIRRRRGRLVMVAVAAALAAGATAAAGDLLQAHTGLFGGGPGTEERSGELIRLDASDAARVVDRIGAPIELPPGSNFDRWKADNLVARDGAGSVMTTSGIRSSLEAAAACSWTGYWLDGYRRGDEAQKARALAVLDQIPTWPATVASDGGGTVASLKVRAEGARTNRPDLFMQDYQINCTGELSPTQGAQPG